MDEAGNSTDEKIFNLQLLVQKLEEELLLYRNGTSMSELLDVIHEKDIEIETWRAKHDEKDEKLKRIAKTSGDVLMKYERLQQELIRQEEIRQTEEVHIQKLLDDNQRLLSDMDNMKMEINELHSEIKKREDEIGSLRLTHWEIEQEQQNRQSSYQKDLIKSQDEHQQEKLLLQATIERLEVAARDSKAREESLQQEVTHWKTCAEEQDQSISSLQRRCANLVKEKNDRLSKLDEERQEMVQQVQQFRDNMNENMRQRDDTIRKKDEKIRELTFQVNILQQELQLKNQRIAQGFGLESKSNAPSSSSNTIAICQDDNLAAPSSSTVSTGVEKSRSKRTALGERTNCLATEGSATGGTTKKLVTIVDSFADKVDSGAISNKDNTVKKYVTIDV
jgi:chromosome segregation ATPase